MVANGQTQPQATKPTGGEKDIEVSRSPLLEPQSPPIDAERVEAIRQAIGNGTYRLEPARIADAMIAAVDASRNSR